ncbi:hypothetical protein ACWPKO_08980 [Coraliomargarita sp. W4R53]
MMERIDAEEGALRLEAFRRQRLDGDFCFEFELEHKPRRARTVRYEGTMWGSWNEQGPITRFRVTPPRGEVDDALAAPQVVELIIQNGVSPQVWVRRSEDEAFRLIDGPALFDPILPGLLYSPFDLQMPFVYWEDFIYEGPTLVGATRVAQQFLMQPPAESASASRGISGVRVGLDDTYNALWRIEVMDTAGGVASRFAVESFQKVQEQYIVKRITLTDYPSKDRTTFDVKAASVGISLARELFSPESMLSVDAFAPQVMNEL